MKKIYLTLIAVLSVYRIIYAQNTYPYPSSGNIGIGTTSPSDVLDVRMVNNATGMTISGATNTGDGSQPAIVFKRYNLGTLNSVAKILSGVASVNQNDGDLLFQTGLGTNAVNAMYITGAGNVGIGTTSPTQKLAVAGNFQVIFTPVYPTLNVLNIVGLGFSGITGAQNWSLRGVYQYPNGVGLNAVGGDLDILKSLDGQTILATKTDGTPLGNVLIGKTSQANNTYKLDVNGTARANGIVVNADGADFVFAPSYKLFSLANLKKYIEQNHHLPEIPSAKQMRTDGLNLGDNQMKLLQKVEELTMYTIAADKKIEDEAAIVTQQNTQLLQQQAQLKAQQAQIDALNKKMELVLNTIINK